MVWGFSDNYFEYVAEFNAAPGGDSLTFSTVPAGEVWVVTQWAAVDVNTAIAGIGLQVKRPGGAWDLDPKVPGGAGVWVGGPVHVVLKAGDYISMGFGGTVAGDDLHGNVGGYKMAVA